MNIISTPPELTVIFLALITFVLVEGEKALGKVLGVDLSGKFTVLAAAVTALLVGILDVLLGFIPPAWEGVANAIITVILALIGSSGLWQIVKRFSGTGIKTSPLNKEPSYFTSNKK